MDRLTAIVAAAAALAAMLLAAPADSECLEDMPCWDCTSMGNGICGP